MKLEETNMLRLDGRNSKQLRPITLQYDALGYSSASVLFEQGNTKVLACVSLQPQVPRFLKGKRTGWLSAEYAMLPCSTQQRSGREYNARNQRNVEISRLIGRCLRTAVDLSALGEQTILVDCDVIQADGGTRVACITAASLALQLACKRWYAKKITKQNIFKELIGAISVGLVNNKPCLDLSYLEDKDADADFNFVITESGNLVEIQGTAEKAAMSWNAFDVLKDLALYGVKAVLKETTQIEPSLAAERSTGFAQKINKKPALFSLGSRINK